MQSSNYTTAVVGLALLTIGLVGFAVIGGAATTEMANETVTFDADENVTIDVTWNDSIADVENASASVTIYNATEYEDSSTNATVVLEDTIAAEEGNTTSATYTTDDGLEDGTDYRVLVEADDTEADTVIVDDGTVGGLFTGLSDGSPGFGAGVALVAIAAAAMLARRGS